MSTRNAVTLNAMGDDPYTIGALLALDLHRDRTQRPRPPAEWRPEHRRRVIVCRRYLLTKVGVAAFE